MILVARCGGLSGDELGRLPGLTAVLTRSVGPPRIRPKAQTWIASAPISIERDLVSVVSGRHA